MGLVFCDWRFCVVFHHVTINLSYIGNNLYVLLFKQSSLKVIHSIHYLTKWAGHIARMGGEVEKGLVGNLEAKGPLGRLMLRWEERMILKEFFFGVGGVGLVLD
jgi:hypothetical protein